MLRLGVFGLLLTGVGLVTVVLLPLSRAGIADAIDPFGWAAPVVFVVASALLGAAFVPGPLLAGASGALFGAGLGFAVSLAASVLSAVVSTVLSRRAGQAPVEVLSGDRATALIALARRRGLLVVVIQRLLPGIPDAPFSYVFGAVGLGVPAVAIGTALGSAPRGFAYTALGDAAVTHNGPLAAVGLGVAVAVSVVGVVAGAVVVRRHRRDRGDHTATLDATAHPRQASEPDRSA